MIVDRASLDVRPFADASRRAGRSTSRARGVDWSNELVAHVVELKNPQPVRDLATLPHAFADRGAARQRAAGDARRAPDADGHASVDGSGRGDVAVAHGEGAAIYATFDRLFDCRRHGWSNLQSMHVNLPFDGDDEFARLHAAVRVLLPIIPALAASSPYAGGRAQPALDQRLVEYRDNSLRFP